MNAQTICWEVTKPRQRFPAEIFDAFLCILVRPRLLGEQNSGLQTQGLLAFLEPKGKRPRLVISEVSPKSKSLNSWCINYLQLYNKPPEIF